MKRVLFFFLIISLLYSCSTDNKSRPKEGLGGVINGGTLRINENNSLNATHPHLLTDLVSSHICSQIYEGLVKFDAQNLSIIPSLAESWEIDPSGKIYIFKLKKGVKFHDNLCFKNGKGREITSSDVKYSLELLCKPGAHNISFGSTLKGRLKGAEEFYNNNSSELEGLRIIDDYTLQLELTYSSPSFLNILAHPALAIVCKEAFEKYGISSTVGTGAFVYSPDSDPKEKVILTRNLHYHGKDSFGNILPYLDTLLFTFINSKSEELEAFQEKRVDIIIGLPSDKIREVIETKIEDFQNNPPKFVVDRSPELATHYYEFNTVNSVFKDKRLRLALSYAIDRERILNQVLKGEAYGPGIYGITPPYFEGYDIKSIQGYSFDPVKAKELMAEAGYPGGKDFPSIKLIVSSTPARNTAVALDIAKQLKDVLNINLELEMVSYEENLESARYAKGDIFRGAWIADYPSPESFLSLLYGKQVPQSIEEPSFPNVSRYVNSAFDSLYEAGIHSANLHEGYNYLLQAEQVMIQDAPLLILWYDEKYRLYQANVKNFYSNPINYWDFSKVFLLN